MPGKRYSAGAIFLQVVPVFGNVQKAIESEAKEIDRALGDRMEKSGEKAGERAGKAASKKMSQELGDVDLGHFEGKIKDAANRAQRAFDKVNLDTASEGMLRDMDALDKRIKGLTDKKHKLNFSGTQELIREVNQIDGLLQRVLGGDHDLDVDHNLNDISKSVKGLQTELTAAFSKKYVVEVELDTPQVERQMGLFERTVKKHMQKARDSIENTASPAVKKLRDDLVALGNLRVGPDIKANQIRKEVREIMVELDKLSRNDPDIDVKVEAGKAYAELLAFDKTIDAIDGKTINVNAKVDTRNAQKGLLSLVRGGDDAANSFRSFNGVLFAAASLGPALIPILGGIAGGLLAIGPAAAVAGAGLTSVLIGFSGISDAVEALQARQDQAAMNSQTLANAEESGARQVAQARESAADQIESALDRQADAQERYRDSIKDVQEAEEALREARRTAADTGADLDRARRENALAIDQALLDEFNATTAYNSVMADGSSTNAEQEQARINMEEAKLRMEELRNERRELAQEQRRWDRDGVNGTDEVRSAQEQLNDAIDAQREAYEDLRDAAADVDEAREDGARRVADAINAQADALDNVSSQQNAVNNAFDNLGPAGKKFARFIFEVKKGFYDLRDEIQSVLLPQVQSAIEDFFDSRAGRILRRALVALADSFGRLVGALSKSFQGPVWTKFFEMLADLGPEIQEAYGKAFIAFMEGLAAVLTVLAPYALDFAEAIERIAIKFANWAASKEGQKQIQDFMEYAKEVGPDVVKFVIAFAAAATNLAVGLAAWGDLVLDKVIDFLTFISEMDPKVLAALSTAFLVMITSSQSAYAAMNLMNAGVALLANPIGLLVLLLVGLAAAFVYLYETNEDFKKFIDDAWSQIGPVIKETWEKDLKPALMEFWESIQYLWKEVLQPFLAWLGPILVWYYKTVIPLWMKYYSILFRTIAWLIRHIVVPAFKFWFKFLAWAWEHIVKPTIEDLAEIWQWLWKNVAKPVFGAIKKAWHGMATGMEWAWKNVLKPIFSWFTDDALPGLEGAFQTTVDAIETIWDGLAKVIGTPIKFVLDKIINEGLIEGFNKVAGWVGMDGFDKIPIPKFLDSNSFYATGGVLPGYTPGRDVHSFYSPTAGNLHLSGGEAIMRPEFTRGVGKRMIDYWNSVAAKGGVRGIQNAMGMGSYWLGGVLPLPGARVSQHTSGYSGYAADLNFGSGYDDFGMAIKAWKDGIIAQMNYIGDASYGRWAILNHAGGQSSLYAHMSAFGKGLEVGQKISAGQTVGYVGDLGNTGTPPTSHLHFEINGGGPVNFADTAGGDGSGSGMKAIPGWLMGIVKDPLKAVKGWVTDPIGKAADSVTSSPIWPIVSEVPKLLAKKVTDKVWDIMPGWVKTAAGWAGNAAEWAVGGVKHAADIASDVGHGIADGAGAVKDFLFKDGGILPYNGTMKYDSGGYLPPGLTSVVNLTGKPEPVFTADQFADGAGGGGTIHYEPHFEGSDLTASDVAGDMNYQFRRLGRGGKYGR